MSREPLKLNVLAFVLGASGFGCASNNAAPAAVGPAPQFRSPPPGAFQTASFQSPEVVREPRPAPANDPYRQALAEAHKTFKEVKDGKNADYIPILANVDPDLYGIALVTTSGAIYEVGAARNEFSIQSVAKVFTLARAIEAVGAEALQKRIGVVATGMPFNSILAIELLKPKRPAGNPLVNAGAIATVDVVPAGSASEKWSAILGTYSAFAGRQLALNDETYRSEAETNLNNRAIANMLKNLEVIKGDPMEALDIYTRECSVFVNARDLAIMGATLAAGGRNPVSRQQVVSSETARHVLAVMMTAGLYENTGDWVYKVGVPAKSGVGGGIVAVVPGRFAVATFAPPLDEAGNSVRGQRAIESIVRRLGANLFLSMDRPGPSRSASASPTDSPAGSVAEGGRR